MTAEQRLANRIAAAYEQLLEIRREQERQMEFAGLRLGVFARLRELERHEKQVIRRHFELTEKLSAMHAEKAAKPNAEVA